VQPSTPVSPEPGVSQTSLKADDQGEYVSKKDYDELSGIVRGLQSDKDRGVNKAQRDVKNLSERFDEFEEYAKMRVDGKTAKQAQREMVLDEVVQERVGTQVAQEPVGSQAVAPSWSEADKFLREQGIDPNDAKVLEMVRQGKSQPQDFFTLALERKTKPVTEPNPAQVMPTGTGGSIDGRNLEVVGAELNAAMTNSKGIDLDLVRKLEVEHLALVPKQ
jgi:hypothetical protein